MALEQLLQMSLLLAITTFSCILLFLTVKHFINTLTAQNLPKSALPSNKYKRKRHQFLLVVSLKYHRHLSKQSKTKPCDPIKIQQQGRTFNRNHLLNLSPCCKKCNISPLKLISEDMLGNTFKTNQIKVLIRS